MARFLSLSILLVALAAPLTAYAQEPPKAPTKPAVSPEKRAYMIQARDKFLENWLPPDVDADVRLQVYFRIDRDGRVSKTEVKTLDGDKVESAEKAAIDAIQRSQPFASIPANVDAYSVDMRFPLRITAKSTPTPFCYPVATFIAAPADKQEPINKALTKWASLLKDRGATATLFTMVDSREKADIIIESSTESKLPRVEKTGFVGDYKVNATLTTATLRLGSTDKAGAPLSVDQIYNNTLQLLGRSFGLASTTDADSVMSTSRFNADLNPEQSRVVSELLKAAVCTPQQAKRGFVDRTAPPTK
jgi:TonB C terminal